MQQSADPASTMPDALLRSGDEYIASLRGRNLNVYLFGERAAEPVDHPVIRPSINAVAKTYDLALSNPQLGSALSPYTGTLINRSPHIAESKLLLQFVITHLEKPIFQCQLNHRVAIADDTRPVGPPAHSSPAAV